MAQLEALVTQLAEYVAEDILADEERDWSRLSPEQINKVSVDLAHRYQVDNFYDLAADVFDNLMNDRGVALIGEAMQRYPTLDFDWPDGSGTMQELVGLALAYLMTQLMQKRYLEQYIAKAIRDLVAEQHPVEA